MVLVARTDIVNRDEEFIYRIASMVIQMIALLYIKDKILKTLDYYD